MTARTVKMFGDIVAKTNENGKLVVMKGEKQISPFEYVEVRELTLKCWALKRANELMEDILFSNGVWFLGTKYAYVLDNMGSEGGKKLIAAVGKWGKDIFDESGERIAFIPDHYRLVVLDGEFLVSFALEGPAPQVKVYDMRGSLLAMGPMEKAIEQARRLKEILERI
jgi:hypothetical protein